MSRKYLPSIFLALVVGLCFILRVFFSPQPNEVHLQETDAEVMRDDSMVRHPARYPDRKEGFTK